MCWPALCPSQPGTSSKRLLVRGVAGRDSTTSPMRQASLGRLISTSVPPVALLAPGVAVVVVTQRLPEAGYVVGSELQPPHPLGALPEIQVRHQQTRRSSVLWLQGLP